MKNGAGVEVDVCVGETRGGPVVVCCVGTLVGDVKPGNPAVPTNKNITIVLKLFSILA